MGDFEPFAHIKAAATGDLAAQRALAEAAFVMASACDLDEDPMPYIQDGLIFARLAAAHGEQADRATLLSALAAAAKYAPDEHKDHYAGEALAMCEQFADEGNDAIGDLLPMIAEQATPAELQGAILMC